MVSPEGLKSRGHYKTPGDSCTNALLMTRNTHAHRILRGIASPALALALASLQGCLFACGPASCPEAETGRALYTPVIEGLDAFRSAHGAYPSALELLVPRFLAALPGDVAPHGPRFEEYAAADDGYRLSFRYFGLPVHARKRVALHGLLLSDRRDGLVAPPRPGHCASRRQRLCPILRPPEPASTRDCPLSESRLRVPHPLALLTGCVILAAIASYLVPAGTFDREYDEATGRTLVVPGTYQPVEPDPVNLFAAMAALPKAPDESGALRRAVPSLVRALRGHDLLIVPIISLFFALGGMVQNMQEEIIPLIPILMLLVARLGFTPLVAVACSAGAAFVGSAFSYASATRTTPHARETDHPGEAMTRRDGIILAMLGATFVIMVVGLRTWGWGFDEMSASFFIMGILVGFVAQMGVAGTAEAYVKGFREMAYAALLIGFARAISTVLEQGLIIDTIVNGLFAPLDELPRTASALGMIVGQALLHVPVPSVSGQAVLTMPVLVPLADLLGLTRQVIVLAYQYGAGLCDIVTPTNGALMAILAAARVRFDEWLRFAGPLYLALVALGGISVALAVRIDLQ